MVSDWSENATLNTLLFVSVLVDSMEVTFSQSQFRTFWSTTLYDFFSPTKTLCPLCVVSVSARQTSALSDQIGEDWHLNSAHTQQILDCICKTTLDSFGLHDNWDVLFLVRLKKKKILCCESHFYTVCDWQDVCGSKLLLVTMHIINMLFLL